MDSSTAALKHGNGTTAIEVNYSPILKILPDVRKDEHGSQNAALRRS